MQPVTSDAYPEEVLTALSEFRLQIKNTLYWWKQKKKCIWKSVNMLWPVPAADEPGVDVVRAYGPSPDRPELAVSSSVRGGEGGDVDGVTDRLIAGRVDHVA